MKKTKIYNSKKYFYRLFFFILIGLIISPETYSQIKGLVTDTNNKALSFSNVVLLNPIDSSQIKGTMTDENGKYLFNNVKPGKYLIHVSTLGYSPFFSLTFELKKSNQVRIIEPVRLKPTIHKLEEASVTAEKPIYEMKIDRMVVNLENSITFKGMNALETLERSPGVTVDRQNNNISLLGKGGIKLMINGRMNDMPMSAIIQMLEGMNAEDIEKIELITAPPAKYEAEGDAGIINIVLKKNDRQGTNGSYMFVSEMGARGKINGNLSLNHRREKINCFANYNGSYRAYRYSIKSIRIQENNGSVYHTNSESIQEPITFYNSARLGLDYDITGKTILGILVSGYIYDYDGEFMNRTIKKQDQEINSILNLESFGPSTSYYALANINLQHKIKEDEVVNFNIDYLDYYHNNPSRYTPHYIIGEDLSGIGERIKSKKSTPLKITAGKIDYSKQLGEKIKIEAGLKGTIYRFQNDISVSYLHSGLWQIDEHLTNKFTLDEETGTAYASFKFHMDKKNQFSGGLRYEYINSVLSSETEKGILDLHYGNIFPSIYFSSALNENNQVQFSFNRRIDRPKFNELAPFIFFMSPNTYITGNENLVPAFSNQYKIEYKYKIVYCSFGYTQTKDFIARFQPKFDKDKSKQYFISANHDKLNSLSIVLAFPFRLTKWWTMRNNLQWTYQQLITTFEGQDLNLRQQNYRIYSFHHFTINKQFSGEVSGFYRSRALSGIYISKPLGRIDAGIQFKSKNNKTQLNLNIIDIFKSSVYRSSVEYPEIDLTTKWINDWEPRRVKLTYIYNFGNTKIKAARSHKTASEEEQDRIQLN